MQDTLRVSMIQRDLVWEDRRANLRLFGEELSSLEGKTDLVVLPEMFTTGFTMRVGEVADTMEGETLAAVRRWASGFGMAVCGSFVVEEARKYFNRAFLATPEGGLFLYDKRHLFRMGGEDRYFTAGIQTPVFSYKGWNIRLLVCYDLRFPVWSRNVDSCYDLLIYVANWPASRRIVWKSLLQARAIENMAYVCGVNRVGADGNGLAYAGESQLYSPKGLLMADAGEEVTSSITTTLSSSELNAFREKFPVAKDADRFRLL